MSSSDEYSQELEKRKKSSSERSKKKLRREKCPTSSKIKVTTSTDEPVEKRNGITNELVNKYKDINRSELEAICERVLIYDQTGVYIPPDKFKLHCQKKNRKHKPTKLLERDSSEPVEAKFGKGSVGTCQEKFGDQKICECCNCTSEPLYRISSGSIKVEATCSSTSSNQPEFSSAKQEVYTDLDKPGCSGIKKSETNSQETNTSDELMKFVDLINSQMDNEEIWTQDYLLALTNALNTSELNIMNPTSASSEINNENTQTVPSEANTELSNILSDSLLLVNETPTSPVVIDLAVNETVLNNTQVNDNQNIEVVDLTTPQANRLVNVNLEVIELLDDSPVPSSLPVRVLDTIDLIDSESDIEIVNSDAVNTDVSANSVKPLSVMECPVCLDSLKNKVIMSTVCGHIFCNKCIRNVIKKTKRCPNCRRRLNMKSIHPLYFNF